MRNVPTYPQSVRPTRRLAGVGLLAAASLAAVSGTASAQPADALGSYFGFEPPRVLVIDDGCGPVVRADFNADGLPDIAVVNNSKSRIEVYYLRATPRTDAEQERAFRVNDLPPNRHYDRSFISVRQRIGAIVPVDADGDGKMDLVASSSDPTAVLVMKQESSERFEVHSTRRVRGLSGSSVATLVGNFQGDAQPEVAVIADDQIMMMSIDREGRLGEPAVIARAAGLRALFAEDFDGNGMTDLLGVSPGETAPLRLWRQVPAPGNTSFGELAAEVRFDLPAPIEVEEVRFADRDAASIAVIERASRRITLLDVAQSGGVMEAEADAPLAIRAFPDGSSPQRGMAMADIDGDGRTDLVATDGESNALVVFPQLPDGTLGAPRKSPAFKAPTSLAAGPWEGSDLAVYVASSEEAAVGAATVASGKSLTFPTPMVLATPGAEPITIAHGTRGSGEPMLAVLAKQRRDLLVEIHAPGVDPVVIEFDDLDRDPSRMELTDIDGDGNTDLVLLAERQAPVLVMAESASDVPTRVVIPDDVPNAGLVGDAGPSNTAIADVDGDGDVELAFASANFVRIAELSSSDGDAAWSIVDQLNAADPRADLVGVAALEGGRIVASDRTAGGLIVFEQRGGAAGGWSIESTPRMLGFPAGPLMAWGDDAVLCVSDEAVAVVGLGGAGMSLEEVAVYRSEEERRVEHEIEVGDVNSDGYLDVVVLDAGEQMCQILTTSASRNLLEATEFKVFESRLFSRGDSREYEPSELIVGDLTGDGHDDILLVVHDRLIIYPQDRGE